MAFVEIITLRAISCLAKDSSTRLLQDLLEYNDGFPAPKISVYRQATIESDLSFHLHWHCSDNNGEKSELGLRLASYLMNLGLVHHTIWKEHV